MKCLGEDVNQDWDPEVLKKMNSDTYCKGKRLK